MFYYATNVNFCNNSKCYLAEVVVMDDLAYLAEEIMAEALVEAQAEVLAKQINPCGKPLPLHVWKLPQLFKHCLLFVCACVCCFIPPCIEYVLVCTEAVTKSSNRLIRNYRIYLVNTIAIEKFISRLLIKCNKDVST